MIELDKYRMLALMGLPFALQLSRRVDALNAELHDIMDHIRGPEGPQGPEERRRGVSDTDTPPPPGPGPGRADQQRELLDRLCRLAAGSGGRCSLVDLFPLLPGCHSLA